MNHVRPKLSVRAPAIPSRTVVEGAKRLGGGVRLFRPRETPADVAREQGFALARLDLQEGVADFATTRRKLSQIQ